MNQPFNEPAEPTSRPAEATAEPTSRPAEATAEPTSSPAEATAVPPPPGQPAAYANTYTFDPPKTSRKKGCWIWVAIVAAALLIAAILGLVSCNEIGRRTNAVHYPDTPYIAVLYVEGVISSAGTSALGSPASYQHQFTLDAIDDLIVDPNNKALVLFVDSPGGGVYESDELYFKIKAYKDTVHRPVYAYMGSMAASGGYYISAPADRIIANRNCWTGSIGVTLGTMVDLSQFLSAHGIKTNTITSGRNKAMGGYTDPMTAEQRAIFQGLVDEAYEQFTGIVAEERKLDLDKVRQVADGRIYTAKQALNLGLIDHIASYDEALEELKDTHMLQDVEVFSVVYQDTSLYRYLFGQAGFPTAPRSESEILLNLADQLKTRPVSYICEALAH